MHRYSHLGLRFLFIIILLSLGFITVKTNATPIKRLSDITTGSMIIENEQGASLLPLMDTQITMTVQGLNAHTEVKQFFENPSSEYINATYFFPLPDDAAVDSLEMLIGDRRIIGTIKEKQEAKRIYQEAVRAGKKAALLEQDKSNLFRNKVANIAPGETIEITISMYHKVRYRQGEFSIRFPSTLTPKYDTQAKQMVSEKFKQASEPWQYEPSSEKPQLVAKETRSDLQLSIDVIIDAGVTLDAIKSSSHAISSKNLNNSRYEIRLQNYQVADRDFELSWTPTSESQPRVLAFEQSHDNDPGYVYTQLVVLPPALASVKPLSRNVTFIIDHSGSMEGQSMVQAKLALAQAINNLSPTDRFNVIGFNHTAKSLFQGTVAFEPQTRDWALSYISKMQADGGTEMHNALALALNEPDYPDTVRQVIFLTDGAVNYEDQLFELIHNQLGDARLFTIGIGSAPNSYFMRKAAEFGQGSYTYISNTGEVATKMGKLLEQLRYPVMEEVSVEFSEPVEHYPLKVPDLYLGEPLHLIIRRPATDTEVQITGIQQQMDWRANLSLDGSHKMQNKGIARIWARQKIQQLLDQQIIHSDYEAHKDEILDIALRHQLLSPYTSFIAVEERISRPKSQRLKDKNIPNIAPNGSQSFAYPATALNWRTSLVLGLILLAFGIWLQWGREVK